MAAPAAANLNNGPPLPANLQPAPQPSMATLAGSQGTPPSGSAALQQAVVEKLMMAEKVFDDIARIYPPAASVLSGVVDEMRRGMGALLAAGTQTPTAPASAGMTMPGPAPTS